MGTLFNGMGKLCMKSFIFLNLTAVILFGILGGCLFLFIWEIFSKDLGIKS